MQQRNKPEHSDHLPHGVRFGREHLSLAGRTVAARAPEKDAEEERKQKEREEVWCDDEEKKTTRRDESDDTDIK